MFADASFTPTPTNEREETERSLLGSSVTSITLPNQSSALPLHTQPDSATHPESIRKPPEKLYYLEAIRGLAAFVVVLNHYKAATLKTHTEQDWWANPSGYNNLYSLFWNGNYAVTVFFLLSGRVLTLSVLKKGFCIESLSSLSSSTFRRPIRLAFPVLCGLLLSMTLQAMGAYNGIQAGIDTVQIKTKGVNQYFFAEPPGFQNFGQFLGFWYAFFVNDPLTNLYYPCGVIWTLPIEIVGSWYVFLVTLVLLPLKRYSDALLSLIIFVLWWANSWYSLFIMGLLIAKKSVDGSFKRFLEQRGKKVIWTIRVLVGCFFLLSMTTQLPFYDAWKKLEWIQLYQDNRTGNIGTIGGKLKVKPFNVDEYTGYRWDELDNASFLSTTLLLLLFEITPFLQNLLSLSPFIFLGKISYGLYLGHPFVLLLIMPHVFQAMAGLELWTRIGLGVLVYVPLSLLIGWGFWRTFDLWSLKISRKLRDAFVEEKKKTDEEGSLGKLVKTGKRKIMNAFKKN